jgi:Protein of unknown function (DUF1579)
MRIVRITLFVALALSGAAHAEDDLYARVAQKLAGDKALAARLGKPGAEMASVAWMKGRWRVEATVQAGPPGARPERGMSTVRPMLGGAWLSIEDRYPSGNQDHGFLGYDPGAQQWVSVALDAFGNAVTTRGPGWSGGRLELTGEASIVGIRTILRQTITRDGADAYVVTNEERAADGRWRLLDTYRYTRR